jgi:hypothetical protein
MRNNRRIVGHVVFNAVRVASRKVSDQFFPELLVIIHLPNNETVVRE